MLVSNPGHLSRLHYKWPLHPLRNRLFLWFVNSRTKLLIWAVHRILVINENLGLRRISWAERSFAGPRRFRKKMAPAKLWLRNRPQVSCKKICRVPWLWVGRPWVKLLSSHCCNLVRSFGCFFSSNNSHWLFHFTEEPKMSWKFIIISIRSKTFQAQFNQDPWSPAFVL